MGLFSKNKDNQKVKAPMPPAPPINVPPMDNSIGLKVPAFSSPPVSAPQVPGQNLDDIKTQVTAQNISPNLPPIEPNLEQPQINSEQAQSSFSSQEQIDLNSSSENLFDFSDIEMQQLEPEIEPIPEQLSQNSAFHTNSYNSNTSQSNLNFVNNSKNYNTSPKNETYFVTTSQYKNLLEIIDSVKTRVKNSNDSHLRLLDIKAEEDIEFENLRKDFQFIEDKLYELDGIIFDK